MILKDKARATNYQLQSIKSRVSELLDIPEYSISGMRIEITSGREAVVENCRGILEYNAECVRLVTPGVIVKFNGTNLYIGRMAGNGAVISGEIESISFSNVR